MVAPYSFSSYRTAQLRRSLLSASSSPALISPLYGKLSSSTGSAPSSRSLVELLSSALHSSKSTSPTHLPVANYGPLNQSLPRICYENIGKILSFKEGLSSASHLRLAIVAHRERQQCSTSLVWVGLMSMFL